MTRRWRSSICAVLFASATLASPWRVGAQQPPVTPTETAPAQPSDAASAATAAPVSEAELARIRRALGSEPTVRINGDQVRFYLQVVAKPLTFAEFSKGYDFVNGPTRRGNPMTHSEFVAMVTPRELQNSQAGITPRETLEFALTNWASQALVKKAWEAMQNARTEREVQEIRSQIERELAELKAAEGQ